MGLLENCLEFLSLAGAGKVEFRTGSAAEPLDERLSILIETTNVPADVAVFVLTPDAASEGLRDHLRSLTEQGLDLVVNLVDPATMRLVEGLGTLKAAQLSLGGVPVTVPTSQHDPRVVAVPDRASGGSERRPDAYRLLPAAQLANRDHLRALPTKDLGEWLKFAPEPVPDQPVTDLSLLLGVPHALFGRLPAGDLGTLRDSPVPLSLRLVEEALDGTLTHVGIDVLGTELTSGNASAALVRGWATGSAEPRTFWLLRDPEVGLRWADPLASGERTRAAELDGAVDERAAIAEQQRSTSLLLDAHGRPYAPVADPVQSDESAEVTRVGQWSEAGRTAALRQLILDVAEAAGVPVVVVDVRRGPLVAGTSTLDPVLSVELAQALRAQPGRPLVVATERNDQLEWLVREQFSGATVVPEFTGLDDTPGWLAQSGTGLAEPFKQLTVDSLVRVAPAPAANPLPAVLGKWLRSPTWAAADTYFQENAAALQAPEVVTALGERADLIAGQGEALAADGTQIKDSPFFQPDRTLPAFRSILDVAARAADGPGARSYAPSTQLLIDEIPRHTAQSDENLLLGYLAARPLTHLDPAPPPYTTGLLWMRELMQALVDKQVTGLRVVEILAVMAARGELFKERAGRTPNAKEVFRSNATLAQALINIIFSEHSSGLAARSAYDVDFLKKIGTAIDCLPGADRTAWNYIYEYTVLPRFTAEREPLNLLLERIASC